MPADLAVLTDRAVLAVCGAEARDFLQRLVTSDVADLAAGAARYAALLTPQGKIVTDFFVVAQPGGSDLYLDAPAATAADLVKKLSLYRLRAKIAIEDRSATLGVIAYPAAPPCPVVLAFDDPRAAGLWQRAILAKSDLPEGSGDAEGRDACAAARIGAGVPEGGTDFAFGEAFPHDANLDHLNGVDFGKGCYVGQEVVSRMQHRGTARKRVVAVDFDGPAPAPGTPVTAAEAAIGTMGGSIPGLGLALLRLDRAAEAAAPLTAAGTVLRLRLPAWA